MAAAPKGFDELSTQRCEADFRIGQRADRSRPGARAGINTALLGSWSEIAGEDFADCTRPEKIAWARGGGDDGSFRPGVLTIACEGARALFLTHAQGELIQRINSFFGFAAVHQIRIVQKPVSQAVRRSRPPAPLKGEAPASSKA